MNKRLSRRDFLKLAGVTSASFALSACGVKATELPTATLIPPTGTPLPTETLTPTLTSTPILPLEQLPQTKQALTEFVKAFKAVGVDISTDQLIQKGLEIRTIIGKGTEQYEIALAHVESPDGLGGDYPLMIKAEGSEWKTFELKQIIKFGSLIGNRGDGHGINFANHYANYDALLRNKFNYGTVTASTFLDVLKNGKGNFDWTDWEIDRFLNQGGGNVGANLLFGAIIFPEEYRTKNSTQNDFNYDFMKKLNALESNEIYAILDLTIDEVVSHLEPQKDRIHTILVLNEPHLPIRKDPLVDKLGIEYYKKLFQTIREKTKDWKNNQIEKPPRLMLNDIDIDDMRVNNTLGLIDMINSDSKLIDVVGIQFHLKGQELNEKEFKKMTDVIELYKSYGVDVDVTELSIDMTGISLTEQAKLWREAGIVFGKSGCTHITVWDIGDKYAWEGNGQQSTLATVETKDNVDYYELKLAYYTLKAGYVEHFLVGESQ